jgi:hypothetical protein
MRHHAIAVCVLALAAGCAGVPAGSPSSPTDHPTPVDPETPIPAPSVTPGDELEQSARLEVEAFQAPPVHVTVTDLENGSVVVNETDSGTFAAEFDEGTVLVPERDYRAVVRVDGEVRWNRTVHHYEAYELCIAENGTVELKGHAMA